MSQDNREIADLVLRFDEDNYVAFYDVELITLTLTKSFIDETKKRLKAELKAEGVGFLKRAMRISEYWYDYNNLLKNMSVEELINTHTNSRLFKYEDITKYTLEEASSNDLQEYVNHEKGRLRIEDQDGKSFQILHTLENHYEEYIEMKDALQKRVVKAEAVVN